MSYDLILWRGRSSEPTRTWRDLSRGDTVEGLDPLDFASVLAAFRRHYGNDLRVFEDDGTIQGRGWELAVHDEDTYSQVECAWSALDHAGALAQLRRAAHAAGCHVFDPQTGEFFEASPTSVPSRVKPQSPPVPVAVTRALERVWAAPGDTSIRRAAAEVLLAHDDPWGRVIQLQLASTRSKTERTELDAALGRAADRIAGPIARIARDRDIENGFLTRCCVGVTNRDRLTWEAAVSTSWWATVERVQLDTVLATPLWWASEWIRAAPLPSLVEIEIGRIRLAREAEGRWRVADAIVGHPGYHTLNLFRRVVDGLSPGDESAVDVPPKYKLLVSAASLPKRRVDEVDEWDEPDDEDDGTV